MQEMGVEYSSEQRDKLLAYLQLLITWNRGLQSDRHSRSRADDKTAFA